ncbi:MAG TPA: pyridoxal-phosphate dependent enzyme [Saprospiraceae bacterium]|nr:pyridoxal-phosphate dependent enzyme [Saprospiraceae bacterium]
MDFIQGPVQPVQTNWSSINLFIKRLDLIDSWASGNKYYKLKYNIKFALEQGITTIVSKGGIFSNHLDALAKACHYFGLKCVCIVRSYTEDLLSPTVKTLQSYRAEIVYMNPPSFDAFDLDEANEKYPGALFIPEGGSNYMGIKGAGEIIDELQDYNPTHVIIAGGSMSSAAGIIQAAWPEVKIIIVPAWKGCTSDYMQDFLDKNSIEIKSNWELWPDYHFGGFGKTNNELFEFMFEFTQQYKIPLDPVYTGKLMFAIRDKTRSGYFNPTDKVIAIHTGGLQGIAGYVYRKPEVWGKYAEMLAVQGLAYTN